MREIKFRAWDNRFKSMDFGSGDLLLRISKPDFTEPMQYTGIKDKNDIDIYEGDVIEFIQTHEDGSGNTLHLGVVTWEDGSLYSKSIKNEISRGMGGMSKNCTREVIGNIYENPELIKGEITN